MATITLVPSPPTFTISLLPYHHPRSFTSDLHHLPSPFCRSATATITAVPSPPTFTILLLANRDAHLTNHQEDDIDLAGSPLGL
ncbi:hypothetical protein SLEP1_g58465 [Rubroshorea leprosula]|uniref:Uncharacterized protein n=1 Tax=Rubroshorea leprosula TaxID=152421 RepID=A0AAV5MPH5_9ROSI|nr:hypothetical protein SLEP1_g58465 [Rubroshorea leprosula]